MSQQFSDTKSLLGRTYSEHNEIRKQRPKAKNFQSEFHRNSPSKYFSNLSSYTSRRRTFRFLLISVCLSLILFLTFVVYFDLDLKHFRKHLTTKLVMHPNSQQVPESSHLVSYDSILQDSFSFDINGSDVMVFLHIQKTGGTTFGKHLVQDIDLESPCICHRKLGRQKNPRKPVKKMLRCECFRPNSMNSNWLFSRHSVGWKCGLHADWTELTECVDDYLNTQEGSKPRRYFYLTILRDPVDRYLSEFHHVQRGATWKGSLHMCHGEPASKADIPPCFDEDKGVWENVSLQTFMDCPSNWAINRQTRMLADLRLVECYNVSAMTNEERDRAMLQSAKNNLEQLAFFGLTEYQNVTQYMFEETFNLKFRTKFVQHPASYNSYSREIVSQIGSINRLDVELYEFAKKLFFSRFEAAKTADTFFDDHFNRAYTQSNFNFNELDAEDDYSS